MRSVNRFSKRKPPVRKRSVLRIRKGSWLEIVLMCWVGCLVACLVFCLFSPRFADAEAAPLSERIANSLIQHPLNQSSGTVSATWDAETGKELDGLEAEWYNTAKGDYY